MISAALPDDSKKTKAHLVSELRSLRAHIAELEMSQQHSRQTAALLESARVVLETQDFAQAAKSIFSICKNLIGASCGEVLTRGRESSASDRLVLDAEACMADRNLPLPVRGLHEIAYRVGRPVQIDNFEESEYAHFLPPGHLRLVNLLLAPLHLNEESFGLIALANKKGGFSQEDASLIAVFANHLAISFRNSHQLGALRSSEANYKHLSERLEAMVGEQVNRLRQAESLAEVGRTVSTVAHEIRNVLHIIQMGADAMRMEIKNDPIKSEILQEIDYGVSILNAVGKELLDFAKPVKLEYSICSMKSLVENALAAAGNKLQSVTLEVTLNDDACISIDEAKITRALLNVISNAVEAMPHGGNLSISSRLACNNDKPVLLLLIEDTGCGIDEKDMERVQQPFVTTKEHGTGLGISICKKIIDAHGGTFKMDSKPGKGTKVEIRLPMSRTQGTTDKVNS